MTSHKTNITLAPSDKCTGCGICGAVCPKGSISFKDGHLGHVFPVIDEEKCISCGKCEHTCPALNPVSQQLVRTAYASWSKDEWNYKSCTSGGIATELSRIIIQGGGVVYGCAMFPDVEVRHIRVDNLEGLEQLKTSKYVQSDIIGIISSLKDDVKSGKEVIFTGTPCQVAAIRSLFKGTPDNLYLVDLICHGVPSRKLLKDYVRRAIHGKSCTKVTFRNGNKYLFRVWDHQDVIFEMPFKSTRRNWSYLEAFMEGYTLRDSCLFCTYACAERVGDITVGDFWGLGRNADTREIPEHPNGCSVVLPITDKGEQLIEKIRPFVELYQRDKEEAIGGNTQLQHPILPGKRARIFRKVQRYTYWPAFYKWIQIDNILRKCLRTSG